MNEFQKLVFDAVRFSNWAAGQGIYPAEGEDATAPEDFLMQYSDATGDVAWDTLANRCARESIITKDAKQVIGTLVQELQDCRSKLASEGRNSPELNAALEKAITFYGGKWHGKNRP